MYKHFKWRLKFRLHKKITRKQWEELSDSMESSPSLEAKEGSLLKAVEVEGIKAFAIYDPITKSAKTVYSLSMASKYVLKEALDKSIVSTADVKEAFFQNTKEALKKDNIELTMKDYEKLCRKLSKVKPVRKFQYTDLRQAYIGRKAKLCIWCPDLGLVKDIKAPSREPWYKRLFNVLGGFIWKTA